MFGMIARSFFLFLFSFFLKFPPHGKCFNFGFSGGLKHRLQSRSSLRNSRRRLSTLEFKKAKRPNLSATTPEILNQVNNQIRKKTFNFKRSIFHRNGNGNFVFFPTQISVGISTTNCSTPTRTSRSASRTARLRALSSKSTKTWRASTCAKPPAIPEVT